LCKGQEKKPNACLCKPLYHLNFCLWNNVANITLNAIMLQIVWLLNSIIVCACIILLNSLDLHNVMQAYCFIQLKISFN
jgi:hypothetical protein